MAKYLTILSIALLTFGLISWGNKKNGPEQQYAKYCASCHGEQLEAFIARDWQYGDSEEAIYKSIKLGYTDDGMPGFEATFTDEELKALARYIKDEIKGKDSITTIRKSKNQKVYTSKDMKYTLEKVAGGLEHPWGLAFLPKGGLLITDRNGKFYRLSTNKDLLEIKGAPEVVNKGQGGLLDVELHPKFEENRWVYLTYSKKHPSNSKLATTAVVRGKLNGIQLANVEEIFVAEPYESTRHHYGSRIEFDRDGYLYLSVGDRGQRDRNPQGLDNHCGKIHRLLDDGRIPEDNPFVDQKGAKASIYSYGHRNPQGVTLHPETGKIWTHEHGPRGGDEINVIRKGKNYGWPIISYGINYNGTKFTEITEKEGLEQPLLYWVPSIAPCGMDFVTGDRYPSWKGDLLVGSLRFEYVNRVQLDGEKVEQEEKLLKDIGRVRCIKMSNDDYIYVAVEQPGEVYKIIPLE